MSHSLKYNNNKDINEDKLFDIMREVDFLEVIEYYGYRLERWGRDGHEFKTKCPKCFSHAVIIQTQFLRHRFLCTHCEINGDALQYIKHHTNNKFIPACRVLCEIKDIPFRDILIASL